MPTSALLSKLDICMRRVSLYSATAAIISRTSKEFCKVMRMRERMSDLMRRECELKTLVYRTT